MSLDWKLTASRNDLLRELEKVNTALGKQMVKVKELQDNLKRAEAGAIRQNKSKNKWLNDQIGMLKSVAAATLSVAAAERLVTQELERQKQINQDAAMRRRSLAGAEDDLKTNLGKVPKEQAQQFIQDIRGIARVSNADLRTVYGSSASLMSSTAANTELVKNIMAETTPIFTNRPDQLEAATSALGDLMTIAQSNSREDIQAMLGMMLSTMQQARITQLGDFKTVAQAVAAGTNVDSGSDRMRAIQEQLAVFSAVGGSIKDPDGSLTRTAAAELATSLYELLPEENIYRADGTIRRRGTGLKTLNERLERVRGDVRLQREMFEGSPTMERLSARGPIRPVIEAMVKDPESEAYQRLEEAMAGITVDREFGGIVRRNLEELGVGDTSLLENRIRASQEHGLLENDERTLNHLADEAFYAAQREAHDPGWFNRQTASFLSFAGYRTGGMNRADAAIMALEAQTLPLTLPRDGESRYDANVRQHGQDYADQMQARQEQIDILREISRKLDSTNASAAAQVGAQRESK